MRKHKKVGDYEVWELSVKEMMPIMRKMNEDANEGQLHLIGTAVKQKGESIGYDVAGEMGMSQYMGLASEVASINGLDSEGND